MARTSRVPDETIIKLNDLGLSLQRIGEMTGYHLSTVHLRLKQLGVENVDTRRAFMDDVYKELTPAQREWLHDTLHMGQPISAFIKQLIVKEYTVRNKP